MKDLTRIEETIMLAIWRLQDKAYGVTIKTQIKEATSREYLYSTLYTTLDQLERKEYISRRYGGPTPERGGKRKIFFRLTETGLAALKVSFQRHSAVWQGITEESFIESWQNGKSK
jgi:DNA-binding PadR family transcriptional regulator